ncbi:16S rRNA (cytosine(1402)-N(4))-methyltransferase RsmH [Salicibibacter cibarius]|uniref:Ribosomal RNA small subunit methyltransferase H n=1 Tax=Salicibibacter cibarius TaxID=2743000 RepID=A0A7T6Z7F6_9BACI|nr:16S rRNA (cytosine(1402)-N(4))-methyltransferase RsmH [Salicibibacter cibarius]QQK78346.1 16S rRNA (cytosine(1402)-N(4))-methyltransferase RsmH [Salicibibacter cibarius]
MSQYSHETVLLQEAIAGLNIAGTGTYVDCTYGRGGHSAEILKRLDAHGHLYAFDADQEAIEAGRERFAEEAKVTFTQGNFRDAAAKLDAFGVDRVNGVLFDLGVSSPQLDDKTRGFSYRGDEPLDMRMDRHQNLTAEEIVHTWPFESLVHVISRYGEEKFAKSIARSIETERGKTKITSTEQLAELIKQAIPAAARRSGGHPAKRTFQALRIAVNDELQAFEDALSAFAAKLEIKGRMAVITFHSLEDAIAKRTLNTYCKTPELPSGLPVIPEHMKPPMKWINKKPIVPSHEEVARNRRARSARLRIVEKIRERRT